MPEPQPAPHAVSRDTTRVTDLLHRPLRDLRVSVTDRCNFRCPYCMPAEFFGPAHAFLRDSQLMTFGEMSRVLRAFVALGVEKLRLTGGEPLLRADIGRLVRFAKKELRVPDVALTTNGWLLAERLDELRAAGLDRLNISLDSLNPATFARMSGRVGAPENPGLDRVLRAIERARESGFPVKLNAVVQRGVNDAEIPALAAYARERGLTLRFIEFMDAGNHNGWSAGAVVPAREILATLTARWPLEPVAPAYRGEVAARYRWRDGAGEIGLVSSVTEPFCRDCNRARLSADGRFYTCLFATGGHDILGILRAGAGDETLRARIADIWKNRRDRYSEERAERLAQNKPAAPAEKIEPSYIGG